MFYQRGDVFNRSLIDSFNQDVTIIMSENISLANDLFFREFPDDFFEKNQTHGGLPHR